MEELENFKDYLNELSQTQNPIFDINFLIIYQIYRAE